MNMNTHAMVEKNLTFGSQTVLGSTLTAGSWVSQLTSLALSFLIYRKKTLTQNFS